jgi:hypothetical protein
MKLLLNEQIAQMLEQGRFNAIRRSQGLFEVDYKPVVKLFTRDGSIWLLSELHPDDPDIAFGLCDLGIGYPELGSVRISDLESMGAAEEAVERDPNFEARQSLSAYADDAGFYKRIVA